MSNLKLQRLAFIDNVDTICMRCAWKDIHMGLGREAELKLTCPNHNEAG